MSRSWGILTEWHWLTFSLSSPYKLEARAGEDPHWLFDIAEVSHKYGWESLERWAADHAATTLGVVPTQIDTLSRLKFPMHVIKRAARVAHLLDHRRLTVVVALTFKKLIQRNEPKFLLDIFSLTNEIGDAKSFGPAYYRMLTKGKEFWKANDLEPSQIFRLLNGYRSFAQLGHDLASLNGVSKHTASCSSEENHAVCARGALQFWEYSTLLARVAAVSPEDLLGKVQQAILYLDELQDLVRLSIT